jgi:hypothetical protein
MTGKNVLSFLIGIAIVLLIIIIIFVVPIYIEALQEKYWQAQNEDVQQQIKQWNEQKIATYKIGINVSVLDPYKPPSKCTKEYIVDHGTIAKTISNNCMVYVLPTMESLFSIIQTMLDARKYARYDNNDCHGPYHMDVVYDEKYHFPQNANPTFHPKEGWRFPTTASANHEMFHNDLYYLYALSCTFSDLPAIQWEIYTFTPLK